MIYHIGSETVSEEELEQLNEIRAQQNALDKIRSKIKQGPSLPECEICGEDIPQARQNAISGCTTCITCQSKIEQKSK